MSCPNLALYDVLDTLWWAWGATSLGFGLTLGSLLTTAYFVVRRK